MRSHPFSGVQEYRSTGVQEYQISGNSIIIMPSPRKSNSHEYVIKYRCHNIRSSVPVPGDSMSSVKCYYIKCQVAGDKYSMASIGVRYQVISIAWQVLVYTCQGQVTNVSVRVTTNIRYQLVTQHGTGERYKHFKLFTTIFLTIINLSFNQPCEAK